MGVLFRIIWRLIMVTFGFYAAGFAAGIVFFVANRVLPLRFDIRNLPLDLAILRLIDQFDGLAQFLTVYALPLAEQAAGYWLIYVLITEVLSVRSLLLALIAGAAIGHAAFVHTFGMPRADATQPAIAAGIGGALVYWIIAGRAAGLRRRGPKPAETAPASAARAPVPPPVPPRPSNLPSVPPTGKAKKPVPLSPEAIRQALDAAEWAARNPDRSAAVPTPAATTPAAPSTAPAATTPIASAPASRTPSIGVNRPSGPVVERAR